MEMLRICVTAITGAVLSLSIKKENPQFALLIGLGTGIVIFFQLFDYISYIYRTICQLSKTSGIDDKYLSIVFKIIAIAYITQFGCDICRDAGENAAASKVDMAGRVIIAFTCMPVVMAVIQEVGKFI